MWYGTLSFQKIQWCKNNKSTNDDLPLTKNSTCESKSISTQIYFISNTTCFKYHVKMTLLVVKIIFVNIIFFSIEFGPKLYINIFVFFIYRYIKSKFRFKINNVCNTWLCQSTNTGNIKRTVFITKGQKRRNFVNCNTINLFTRISHVKTSYCRFIKNTSQK